MGWDNWDMGWDMGGMGYGILPIPFIWAASIRKIAPDHQYYLHIEINDKNQQKLNCFI
jgi:hypothetical protein